MKEKRHGGFDISILFLGVAFIVLIYTQSYGDIKPKFLLFLPIYYINI